MQHLVYLLTNFCLSPAPTPISFKSITVQQKFHGTSFHCPYGSGKRCSWEAGGCGGSTKVVPILLLLFLLIFWCKLLWKLLVITGRRNNGRFNFNKYFILYNIRNSYDDSNCTTRASLCSTWNPDNDASAPLAAWIAWNKATLFLSFFVSFHRFQ